MKIEQIESFLIGGGLVVRLTTDTGLIGIGQTACWGYPTAVQSIVDVYREYLIGQNPLRIEHHWQHLYRMAPFRGTAIMGAVSAIDIALYDIKGKHFEVPVWELLGGNVRDKIRLHLLSGGGSPEANFKAAKAAVDEGFTAVKFDPLPIGYQDMAQARLIGTAVEMTAAAREAGGPDLDLIIELHRKLTPMVALDLADALKPFHVLFLEDPIQIDSISSQAQIAAKSPLPFGNGERFVSIWEFRELLEQGGPQYVRPDVALAGGISHCKKIAAIAESYHCAVVTHNFLGPLITAASLHLDASIPNFLTQEYTKNDEAPHNQVFKTCYERDGGYINIPHAPGLGVELDEELIAQTPYVPMNSGSTPLRLDGSIANAV
jgi:galactonate dehydratase